MVFMYIIFAAYKASLGVVGMVRTRGRALPFLVGSVAERGEPSTFGWFHRLGEGNPQGG
jgi:hypothetical protein